MTRHGEWRGALMVALLGSAGCAHVPRYGDTGPEEVALMDARCTRSEECVVVDAWAGDECHCDAEWRAANVSFVRRWSALRQGRDSLERRARCAPCGATRQPPELALCINAQCVAIRREEVDLLHTRLAPYLSAPPASPCPETPAAP